MTPIAPTAPVPELRCHWPAVLACFVTAVFAWGFGFYGQSVYLAELQRTQGWSAGTISGASSVFYLTGAVVLVRVHAAIARFGSRAVLAGGALLMALGASGFAGSAAVWQLHASALVMACGWAGTSGAAISTTLALFFNRQRGLAISLALNGASVAGFTVAPLLVMLAERHGIARAVPEVAGGLLLVLLPLIALGFRAIPAGSMAAPLPHRAATQERPVPQTTRQALAMPRFWTASIPFGLVILAQVGFVVHLVAFLRPQLGAVGTTQAVALVATAAMAGRLALGVVIDRVDQRKASAASFMSQALALGLMAAVPEPVMLYAGCLLFGLSVGNVITFPALIVQREFGAAAFGLVIGLNTAIVQFTFAFGPALLGTIRDMAGSYIPALGLCITAELAAAAIVLAGRPRMLVSPR